MARFVPIPVSGGAGGPGPQFPILTPKTETSALARALLREGITPRDPIESPTQGFAQLANAFVGRRLQNKEEAAERERKASIQSTFERGIDASRTGVKEFVHPDTGEVAIPGQEPGFAALAQVLAGNPETAEIGLKLTADDLAAKARAKATADARETFTPVPGPGGEPSAQRSSSGRLIADPRVPKAPLVNIEGDRGSEIEIGPLDKGTMLIKDPSAPGGFRVINIAGGSAEADALAVEEKAALRAGQKEKFAKVTIDSIDRAATKIRESDFPIAGLGSLLSFLPGSPQRDVAALIDTVKANVGFDRLQQMRESSPTGGALGQVSNLENKLMQATLGNLELSQSKDQLLANLARVRAITLEIVNTGIADADIPLIENGPEPTQVGTVPSGAGAGGQIRFDDFEEAFRRENPDASLVDAIRFWNENYRGR